MSNETDFDFSVVEQTGLTQGEFAALVGVGRVTVYYWLSGARRPSRHLARRVRRALALLQDALDNDKLPGALPPPRRGGVGERAAYIRAALQ